MTFGSQFQMENASPLSILMFQNLYDGTLKAQFGSSLIYYFKYSFFAFKKCV
jgi:hypothetical protein